MSIQTKKEFGSSFINLETFTVSTDFSSTGTPHLVLHTIEHIDGPVVTHGGGGAAG